MRASRIREASIGIAVHSDELAAVVVRASRVQAVVRHRRSAGNVADDVASLIALVPRRRWLRYRATIAAGFEWCRLKELEGLPPSGDLRMLSRVVRENAASFFLRRGQRITVAPLAREANGRLWAAAFEHTAVTEIAGALSSSRCTRVRAIPSVAAVAHVVAAGTHVWLDGDVAIEMTVDASGLHRLRVLAGDRVQPSLTVSQRFGAIGLESPAAVAAFGAATATHRTFHVWEPEQPARTATRLVQVKLAISIALVVISSLAAILAPGIRAGVFLASARRDAARLSSVSIQAAREDAELSRAWSLIHRVDAVRARRGRITLLLGAFSRVLPESTAIVELRIDSTGGSFTALSPHAADILPQLAGIDGATSARIAGTITRENVAGAQLERATFRFERPRPSTHDSPSPRARLAVSK